MASAQWYGRCGISTIWVRQNAFDLCENAGSGLCVFPVDGFPAFGNTHMLRILAEAATVGESEAINDELFD